MYHGPLEVTANGYWVEAKDLRAGDVFLGANCELSTLVATERVEFDESIRVYNFSVDGDHDYFVIARVDEFGQTCILVHNADYPSNIPGRPFHGKNAANQVLDNLEDHHGVPRHVASEILHDIKKRNGFAPNDNMVFGRTGEVFHPITGDSLGSLIPPKSVKPHK